MDLDTVIVGDMTSVLAPALQAANGGSSFVMLEDFGLAINPKLKCPEASGIMVWSGDTQAIYNAYVELKEDWPAEWWTEQLTAVFWPRRSIFKTSSLLKMNSSTNSDTM
jgi:hypothetical protein